MARRLILATKATFVVPASVPRRFVAFPAGTEARIATIAALPKRARSYELVSAYRRARGTIGMIFNAEKPRDDVALVFIADSPDPVIVKRRSLVFDDERNPARRHDINQHMPDGDVIVVTTFDGVVPPRSYIDEIADSRYEFGKGPTSRRADDSEPTEPAPPSIRRAPPKPTVATSKASNKPVVGRRREPPKVARFDRRSVGRRRKPPS